MAKLVTSGVHTEILMIINYEYITIYLYLDKFTNIYIYQYYRENNLFECYCMNTIKPALVFAAWKKQERYGPQVKRSNVQSGSPGTSCHMC